MALSSHVRSLLATLEAEEAAQRSKGTVHSYSNHGNGFQNVTGSKFNSGMYAGDGNTYNATPNNHNHGPPPTPTAINYPRDFLGHGGSSPAAINNGDTFLGHGNGSFVEGNFNASERNSHYPF